MKYQVTAIQKHLERMLNTRDISTPHLPHYGVPDIFSVYHSMPASIPSFINCITDNIRLYEKRIAAFEILLDTEKQAPIVLKLSLSGRTYQNAAIHLSICCESNGKIHVFDKTC